MTTSSRIVFPSVGCLVLCLSLSTAAHADHVIDAFSDPIAGRCPSTGALNNFIWAGKWTGVATIPACTISQSLLQGAVGHQRTLTVKEPSLTNFITVSKVTEADGSDAIGYGTGLARSGILTLEYGLVASLNLDLSADRAFQLTIEGDMDQSYTVRPVRLTIAARTGAGSVISASTSITHDGVWQIPFTSFPGVSFFDVDYISVTLDASAVSGVDYDLFGGPNAGLRTVSGTTGGY